jgi:hypothetical protein
VKQRTSLPSNDQAKGKGKGKEKAKENDQASVGRLEDAAPIVSDPFLSPSKVKKQADFVSRSDDTYTPLV